MLDEGAYTSVSEIGDAQNISKSYVSRILRLALLAPRYCRTDRRHAADGSPRAGQKPFPLQWERQRDLLADCCR
jgi:hypothetical protein